jgi:hypothetical protein
MQYNANGGWDRIDRPPRPQGPFIGIGSSKAQRNSMYGPIKRIFE